MQGDKFEDWNPWLAEVERIQGAPVVRGDPLNFLYDQWLGDATPAQALLALWHTPEADQVGPPSDRAGAGATVAPADFWRKTTEEFAADNLRPGGEGFKVLPDVFHPIKDNVFHDIKTGPAFTCFNEGSADGGLVRRSGLTPIPLGYARGTDPGFYFASYGTSEAGLDEFDPRPKRRFPLWARGLLFFAAGAAIGQLWWWFAP